MKRLWIKFIHHMEFLGMLYYIKSMGLLSRAHNLMIVVWGFIKVFPDTIASLIMWVILKSLGDHERADKGFRHLANAYSQYITQVKSVLRKENKK